jgi:hypothetical protein
MVVTDDSGEAWWFHTLAATDITFAVTSAATGALYAIIQQQTAVTPVAARGGRTQVVFYAQANATAAPAHSIKLGTGAIVASAFTTWTETAAIRHEAWNVGAGINSDIYLYANNGDANKPGLRYQSSGNVWQWSDDGTTWHSISDLTTAMGGFTVAGDSGSNQTITPGNTLSIIGGDVTIATVGVATDSLTVGTVLGGPLGATYGPGLEKYAGDGYGVGAGLRVLLNSEASLAYGADGGIKLADSVAVAKTFTLGLTLNAALSEVLAASTTVGYQSKVTGDAVQRFTLDAAGKMQWSSGAAAADASMFREGVGTLRANAAFIAAAGISEVYGSGVDPNTHAATYTAGVLFGNFTTALAGRTSVMVGRTAGGGSGIFAGAGHLVFQPRDALDIIFLEGGGNEILRIADAGQVKIYNSGSSAGVSFGDGSGGYDTNLYRSGANVLKTDDGFQSALGFGCNSKTPQTAYTVNAASSDLATVVALCNQIRAALVANGICV